MPRSAGPARPSASRSAATGKRESVVLDAGGLKLNAVLAGGKRIPPSQLKFSIYRSQGRRQGRARADHSRRQPEHRRPPQFGHLPGRLELRHRQCGHPLRHQGRSRQADRSDGRAPRRRADDEAGARTGRRGDRRHVLVGPDGFGRPGARHASAPTPRWCWPKATTPSSPRTATSSTSASSRSRPAATRKSRSSPTRPRRPTQADEAD